MDTAGYDSVIITKLRGASPALMHVSSVQVMAMVAVVGVQAFSIYLAVTNAQLGEAAVSCSGCYTR